jgi:hypothetical protein
LKTVVYQSYRTSGVPAWIERCMATAREWAASKGFEYVFIDDSLFDYVPRWYRERVGGQAQLVSDLARLVLAEKFLSGPFERSVWVDADVLVFDPARFEIDADGEYAFCRETWIERLTPRRALRGGLADIRPPGLLRRFRVNNSVSVFKRGNSFIGPYARACERAVREARGKVSNLEVGTFLLTAMHRRTPLPLLDNVGLFSPVVMRDIAEGGGRYLKAYAQGFGTPVRAANLCASYAGRYYDGVTVAERMYDAVIERLLETGGEIVNRQLRRRPRRQPLSGPADGRGGG